MVIPRNYELFLQIWQLNYFNTPKSELIYGKQETINVQKEIAFHHFSLA